MPIDRKALRQKMQDEKKKGREAVKVIQFPLPDLKGPGGNAFALLAQASQLMKDQGVSEVLRDEFRSEATKAEYEDLLRTINEWFTVVVAEVKYVPIGDVDIASLRPKSDDDWDDLGLDADADPSTLDPEELDEALQDHADRSEQDRKDLEKSKEIDQQIRQELGLGPDDIVIVQIKRKGQSNG